MKIKAYSYVTVLDVSDNSIASVDVMYYLSDSNAELIGGSWQTDPPPWQDGKYYWQKTVTTFTDPLKPASETNPICITGGRGGTGVGIQSITNMYLATEQSNGITLDTPGWSSEFQPISPSKKYLWNYEIFIYTDKSEYKTEPCIMGVYGDSGSSGKGILSIQNLYLTTSLGSGVDTDTKGWSTTPTPTSDTNTYLWNYDIITYTDQSTYETTPHIIGTHGAIGPKGDKGDPGEKGEAGTGVESIIEEYYLSDSKTELIGGSWTTDHPTWSYGKYIWTRSKITYKNPTSTVYTTPICDTSWEVIDSIEIGGKNLLRGTSSMIEYNYKTCNWTMDSQDVVITSDIDEATDSLHIVTNGEGTEYNGLASVITDINFKQGETYTFSLAIRGTFDESKPFGAQIYYYSTNGENKYDIQSRTTWTNNGDNINDGINAVNFQRRYFTFVVPYDYDEASNYMVINIFCNIMNIYIRNFQLERGNKATDWRMADDDLVSQIESAVSTVSGITSKVDQVTQSITNRVWVTDINEYINNYDQSTVQVISQKQNQYQQTVDSLNLNISDIQTTLSTKADGSTVSTLESKINSTINDVNGFKQTVSETYATQDDLNGITSGYATKTEFQQLSTKFSWLVSSNSSSTSLTLTDSMIDAMTKQFVVKSPDGKRVVIENGIVKTDFLQSHNYMAGTGTPQYSSSGTFFNMTDGAMYSKNFVIDSNGSAYLKGTIYATAGQIGDCIIANGKLTIPAANITGKLEADHIVIGSSSLDDELLDLINGVYAEFDSNGNVLGYCYLAQIVISGNYVNDAIVIGINQSGNGYSQCCINFDEAGISDPGLGKFLQIGTAEWRIAKISTSTWNLYVKKHSSNDHITVTEYQNAHDGKTLTWICENSEVPAGATYATKCASFVEIDSTAGGTAGSGALITSGAANSINNKADAAQSAANSAQNTANSVKDIADEANQTASSASQIAQSAQSAANAVKDVADDAKEIASSAEAQAAEAKRYADTALTQSEAAQAYAESVKGIADTAKISAEAAEELAQAAETLAKSVDLTIGKWCYNNNRTYIDGGKIYTGTIAADQIAANAITASKIQSRAITADKITANNIEGINGYINLYKGTFAYWNSNQTAGISWNGTELNIIGSGDFSGTVTCSYLTAIQQGRIANWYFNNQCIYNSYNRNNNYNPNGSHNYDGAWSGAGIYFGEKGLSISSPTKTSEFRVTVDGDFTGTYATITGVLDAETIQCHGGYYVGTTTGQKGFHTISYQSNNGRILIGRLSDRDGDPLYPEGYFSFDSNGNILVNGTLKGGTIQASSASYATSAGSANSADTAKNITVGSYRLAVDSSGNILPQTSSGNLRFRQMNLGIMGAAFANAYVDTLHIYTQIVPDIARATGYPIPTTYLGNGTNRWSYIYTKNSVNVSSDRNLKQDIDPLDTKYENLFMRLRPVSYKYKDDLTVTHTGFIAQEVNEALIESELQEKDFACLRHEYLDKANQNNLTESWGLAYDEFIALNVQMTQKAIRQNESQDNDISKLKQENDSLKERLSKIESLLAKLNITEDI